jgi:hypothetical protein
MLVLATKINWYDLMSYFFKNKDNMCYYQYRPAISTTFKLPALIWQAA